MRRLLPVLLFFYGIAAVCHADDALRLGFKNPPASAKARTWWHWLNGNVTKEGITADLEAMQRVGIQEAQVFNVALGQPEGPATYLGPEWFEMLRFAATEAQRLGMELAFHNAAGWSSSGGPWVTPERSMQKVVFREVSLNGGGVIRLQLPRPEVVRNYYRDIAILAFPKPTTRIRIDDLDIKTLSGRVRNQVVPDAKAIAPAAVVKSSQILDLSARVSEDGTLEWVAPEGEWVVLRLGHTSTGKQNRPAGKGGRGLECDKMSKEAVDAFWEGGVAPILTALGPLAGTVVNNCLIDSYEVGTANWTPRFKEAFARRRGYDCSPYLPTLAGYYVDSGEVTERFLWDFRRSLGDLVADNYYGRFRDRCHREGLTFSVEPYWGPFDNFQVGATGDIVMCEFWSGELRFFDTAKFAASIANLKGSSIVAAEAFTGRSGWLQHPATLKLIGDRAWAQGINRFILHTYVHQPWDVPPGLSLGVWGVDFNRLNTWWEPGKAFLDYVARSQFLLQRGRPVADVLILTGESSPNDGQTPAGRGIKELGYDFDLLGHNSLPALSVQDGVLTTPAGGRYRYLVLPDSPWMRPETLQQIARLSEAGAVVLGPKPSRSPSLQGFPGCDARIAELAATLWDTGRIKADPILQRLARDPVPPSFSLETGDRDDLDFVHRKGDGLDLFFVANSSKASRRLRLRLRSAGKRPELFDAQTGGVRDLAVWEAHADGTTSVEIELESEGSAFIVFREPAEPSEHLVTATARGDSRGAVALPGLKILKAEYGSFLPSGLVDVTEAVTARIEDDKLRIPVSRRLSSTDPAPGYKKELRVEYSVNGERREACGMEGETLMIRREGDSGLSILRAVFGKFDPSTPGVPDHAPAADVTERVKAAVAAGNLTISVDEGLRADRSRDGASGGLRIRYRCCGELVQRTLPAGAKLDLAQDLPGSRVLLENGETIWQTPHPGELAFRTSAGRSGTLRVGSVPQPLPLTGPWELRFPPGRGAAGSVTLDELSSWSDSPVAGIRHFSGTGSYSHSFVLPEHLTQPGIALELDLGAVQVMAEVVVNGANLGVLWKQPFRIDLGDAARAGPNRLDLHVTNLWPNRLIGDEAFPADYPRRGLTTSAWPAWLGDARRRRGERVTFTSHQFWEQGSPLQPSGLLGPVVIRPYARTKLTAR